MSTPGGKGTAPRSQRDDEAYGENLSKVVWKTKEDYDCKLEQCAYPFCVCEVKDERPDSTR